MGPVSIVLEGVRKSYGGATVLSLDRLEIPSGAQWVVTGPSGSGKSTFLNLVGGLVLPDAGKVTVAGREITALAEAERDRFRAGHMGYVFQTFNLLPAFTALENVLLGMLFAGRVDRERAASLLERVGLKERAGQKPGTLSVGQQQRVAIARAVANRPKLLLADEPTGNLDPATGAGIVALLKELCTEEGTTLLCVTHQPQVMEAFKDVKEISCLSGPSSSRA
jgi:ABC-type lipoprotein export system ATPase subunit